jgi:hypothetical protein
VRPERDLHALVDLLDLRGADACRRQEDRQGERDEAEATGDQRAALYRTTRLPSRIDDSFDMRVRKSAASVNEYFH